MLPAAFFLLINFSISSVEYLFFKRLIYFLFLTSFFFFLRRINFNKILPIITAGVSLIIFGYGILQKFVLFPIYLKTLTSGDNFYSQALRYRIETGRIFSIFSLPTLYAIICVILILAVFHYCLQSSKNRILWIFLLILGGVNLIFTQSFGGILCLFAGLLAYLTIAGILKLKYLAPVILVLSFIFFILVGLRFSEAKKFEPLTLRLSNWKQAGRLIRSSPFLGIGLGNYESQISRFTQGNEARSIYAHNFFLQLTAETGMIFPLVILILIFLTRKKLKPDRPREKILYLSIFLVLLVYNLVDIGFYFFTAGLIMSIILSQIYPVAKEKFNIKFKLNVLLLSLLSLVLIFISVSDSYQQKGDFWLSQNHLNDAGQYYQKSFTLNPFQFKSLAGYGQIQLLRNNLTAAEKYLNRAYRLYPDSPFVHYLHSKIALRSNQFFRSLYHASAAFHLSRFNEVYKKWYEYIKDRLQTELDAVQI